MADARCGGDRGSALVEAAIVSPVFLTLILGILEFSLVFRCYLTVDHMAVNGARGVTIDATNGLADFRALQGLSHAGAAINLSGLTRVVVYHATGPTDSIANHAGCASGGSSSGTGSPNYTGACNVYTASQVLDTNAVDFDCTDGATYATTSPSRYWCPTKRNVKSATADYVGFYVEYQYRFLTRLFGGSRKLSADVVSRLEPQALG